MISGINIKNFKTFGMNGKKADFKFSPITIFTGPNGSGKTNVQRLFNVFTPQKLSALSMIDLENVSLGTISDIRSNNIDEDNLELEVSITHHDDKIIFNNCIINQFNYRYIYHIEGKYKLELIEFQLSCFSENEMIPIFSIAADTESKNIDFEKFFINYDFIINLKSDFTSSDFRNSFFRDFDYIPDYINKSDKYIKTFDKEIEIPDYIQLINYKPFFNFSWFIDPIDINKFGLEFPEVIEINGDLEMITLNRFDLLQPNTNAHMNVFQLFNLSTFAEECGLAHEFHQIFRNKVKINDEYYFKKDMILSQFNNNIQNFYIEQAGEVSEFFESIFTRIEYFIDLISFNEIGNTIKPKHIEERILSNRDFISDFLPSGCRSLSNLSQSDIEDWEKWLKFFKISDGIEFRDIEGYGKVIFLLKNGKKINLKDEGFGINSIISLILNIIFSSKGSIAYDKIQWIEEPESNLHPALQSRLADFFVDVLDKSNSPSHSSKNQFIIETHSEYLIRKFQYLVAKGILKKEDISIYYFGNDPKKSDYITEIKIDKNGRLNPDFGEGFFDEASRLISSLWDLESDN